MSATNGKPHGPTNRIAGANARTSPPEPPSPEFEKLRAENRLAAEKIRGHRLAQVERREKRRRDLQESLAVDWVAPYIEALNILRGSGDPVIGGPTSVWQRRYGKNWPIFQTEQELALFRAPARTLLATNGYAQGLVEGLTSYVLGPGCTYRIAAKKGVPDELPKEAVEACQVVVDATLDRNEWFGGEMPGIEEELFGRSIEDGEWILCHYPCEDGWCDFRVQESEQLTQPPGTDFREWGFGVHTRRDDPQKALAYWLQFGDSPSDGEEYGPEEVTHFRRNVRRGMKRGFTDFAFDTYDSLYLAGRLRTNLADTAAQQASIVAVRQHDNGSAEEVQAFIDADADYTEADFLTGNQQPVKQKRRGSWEDIPKGMNYVPGPIATATPIHIQVLDACLRGAGCRWNAPPWLMSGDLNAMNYATSLTAESPFVRTVLRRQRNYTQAFRRPVWFALKHRAKTRGIRDKKGRVWSWEELDGKIELLVTAPSPETRDKLQDAQRAAQEIPLGVQSRQGYMQECGRDVDQIEQDNETWTEKHGDPGQQLPTELPPDAGGANARTPPGLESLLESLEDVEVDVLEDDAPAGKVWKEITVNRGGKSFKQKRLVNAPKAAATKPKKADPQETAAAVKAQLAGDATKLTPKAVQQLGERLKALTVADIKKLKAEHDLKGGKTKADHIAALVGKAKELKKVADKGRRAKKAAPAASPEPAPAAEQPKEEPKPAVQEGPHPVAHRLILALNSAEGLTDDQREHYGRAVARVVRTMPKAALDRVEAHLDGVSFHTDSRAIGQAMIDQLANQSGLDDHQRAAIRKQYAHLPDEKLGGVYMNGFKHVHVDGDGPYLNTKGRHGKDYSTAHGIYGHEFTHALDGPAKEISKSPEWNDAFTKEIVFQPGAEPPLTKYAGENAQKPQEGLAEFGRLVYASDVPHAQIASEFPKATAVFKARGLWPTQERGGPAAKMPEVFEKRIDIGTDGTHADVLKKDAAAPAAPKGASRDPGAIAARLKEIQTGAVSDINSGDSARAAIRGHLNGMPFTALQKVYAALGYKSKLKSAKTAVAQIEKAVMSLPGAVHRADA